MPDQLRKNAIVEKHANAMLAELRQSGFPAIGIAGGVVMEIKEAGEPNECHVFFVLDGDTVILNRSDLKGNEMAQSFLADVACAMLRKPSAT